MGAYLSSPVTDKKSDDFADSDKFVCGLSGMQGWRISMEDAYNCVPQMDNDTGLFAVYDGHGGGEVAIYCSHHFSNTLKETNEYKEGKIEEALKITFMEIDKKLREPRIIKELKLLSQMDPGDPPVTEEDIRKLEEQEKEEKAEVEEETKLLHEEATMSIEELLAKYGRVVNETERKLKSKLKEESTSAEISKKDDDSDTEAVESEADSRDDTQVRKPSKGTGDNEKEKVQKNTQDKADKINEAGDDGAVEKKKLRKTFLKTKPAKVEDEDDSEDDDYEGFESDEAVEGSSSDDDDDDSSEEEDGESGVEEGGVEEDPTNKDWIVEKEETFNDAGVRSASGVEEPGSDSGTTAVVALLRDTDLYVANAGDSRCVLGRKNGIAFDMSEDHKPEDESELARITAAGGHVNNQGRVNGGLNLSRALGDHLYKTNADLPLEKQMISALPDVRHVILEPEDEFLVIACDGIWNVLTSQEVVSFIRARLHPDHEVSTDNGEGKKSEQMKLSTICEELFQRCLAPDTTGDGTGCDNMTCIIVQFKQDWLNRRHSARGKDSSLPENNQDISGIYSANAKGDSLIENAKPKTLIETSNEIKETNKRPLIEADDPTSCLNGDSLPRKKVKLDESK